MAIGQTILNYMDVLKEAAAMPRLKLTIVWQDKKTW
jgi:hypothetical protein